MLDNLRHDAYDIFCNSIEDVKPEISVCKTLSNMLCFDFLDRITVIAIGKAAWRMAKSSSDVLGDKIKQGVVITKYGHSLGHIPNMTIYEAGHPLSDANTLKATLDAIKKAKELTIDDTILMLISGGGSALFEYPINEISLEDLIDVTDQLIKVGADIIEINTIRKRLSAVKAGRFGEICAPASIISLVLSDVIGDRLDTIASGPIYHDETTCEDVQGILRKYNLRLSENISEALKIETPKSISEVNTVIISNVVQLCEAAKIHAAQLGYDVEIIFNNITENVEVMAENIVKETRQWIEVHPNHIEKKCFIYGGEMVVEVKGTGLGGRCQHFALKVAELMQADDCFVVLAAGSDGTDGPTDAAGAIVDSRTSKNIKATGYDIVEVLKAFDAYHALKASGDLLITGPTGTNVNDLIMVLIDNT